jgi:hypothetical protein
VRAYSSDVFAGSLALLLAAGCAVADPFDAMPRKSLEDLRATLPDPSPERAFIVDGDVEFPGTSVKGRYRLSVEPGVWNGQPAWLVVEEEDDSAVPSRDGFPREPEHRTWWLSRDLRVLKGEDPDDDGARTMGGVLLLFRSCPAEVAAYGEPPDCPYVASVAKDGSMTCSAPLEDMFSVRIDLSGKSRTPVELERWLGWHRMGSVVVRPARR